jgi:hypothetical protein
MARHSGSLNAARPKAMTTPIQYAQRENYDQTNKYTNKQRYNKDNESLM